MNLCLISIVQSRYVKYKETIKDYGIIREKVFAYKQGMN